MPISVSFIKRLESIDPQLRGILIALIEEIERQREESITKKEFSELRDIVKELAEAQKRTEEKVGELAEAQRRTEERLDSLAQRVEELAEAQKKTEQRLNELAEAQRRTEERVTRLEQVVEELAEAQRRSEERITRLEQAVLELVEAQKKTEQRLNELAEAQRRTEERVTRLEQVVEELAEAQRRTEERLDSLAQRVEELAEAQKKTEEEIRTLVKRVDSIEERLEGISNSVGYSLENRTYSRLPRLLREKYGLYVEGRLIRKYVTVDDKQIQVNIYGHGKRHEQDVLILGECKVRISRKEILRFERYAEKIAEQERSEAFLLVVAHDFPPPIEEFLKNKNIAYFWSYELED